MRTDATFLGLITQTDGASAQVQVLRSLRGGTLEVAGQTVCPARPEVFLVLRAREGGILAVTTSARMDTIGEGRWPTGTATPLSLSILLLGSFLPDGAFARGLHWWPAVGDEVHVADQQDLHVAFAPVAAGHLPFGRLAVQGEISTRINLDKLVSRHAAIVGSTGSGKTNAVAVLLKSIVDADLPGARVVVIDPHGEYARALGDRATVFSIGGSRTPLEIPYWALSYAELMSLLVDRSAGSETAADVKMKEIILAERELLKELPPRMGSEKTGAIEITPDTPLPFSLRKAWHQLDWHDRATYQDDRTTEALVDAGSPEQLKSAKFRPYLMGAREPYKGNDYGKFTNICARMRARILDPRLRFLLGKDPVNSSTGDLAQILKAWLDAPRPIRIFDLNAAPSIVLDVVVGAVVRLVLEAAMWGHDLPGIGCDRPLLFVFEEAHSYLPRKGDGDGASGFALSAVRRLIKEGRKYGLGALIVTQRPSEIDGTILSQCGSFLALRLTNAADQSVVRQMLPDGYGTVLEALPALPVGEGLLVGQAADMPMRVALPRAEPRPRSDDPEVAQAWRVSKSNASSSLEEVVRRWIQNTTS